MSEFTNKGLIVGNVYHSDGQRAANYYVRLMHIDAENGLRLAIEGKNGGNTEKETRTDSNGKYFIPFLWNASDLAEGTTTATVVSFDDMKNPSPDSGSAVISMQTLTDIITPVIGQVIPDFGSLEGLGDFTQDFILSYRKAAVYPFFKALNYISTANLLLVGAADIWLNP